MNKRHDNGKAKQFNMMISQNSENGTIINYVTNKLNKRIAQYSCEKKKKNNT